MAALAKCSHCLLLDEGYLLTAASPDLERGVAPPPTATAPRTSLYSRASSPLVLIITQMLKFQCRGHAG